MKDVPEDLAGEARRIRDTFAIKRDKLKQITDHFILELERGLSNDQSDIPMNITWAIGTPTGSETGNYLTIDMGGTNLRVCEVTLTPTHSDYTLTQSKYKLPEDIKSSTADRLWEFTADCLEQFLEKQGILGSRGKNEVKLPLAFTFSYPVTQESIRHGVLQRWTKGFDIKGVEGCDVVLQLEEALRKRDLPVEVVALVNDTTGTLIASAYKDPEIQIGSIFSTGCNAAYMEDCGSIPKIAHHKLPPTTQIAINTEYGAFDNSHRILPRTPFDLEIDASFPRPGQQTYEKMVAGLYIGELVRLILLHFHTSYGLFAKDSNDITRLRAANAIDSSILSKLEEDYRPHSPDEVQALFREALGLNPLPHELELCCFVVEFVCTRAARLYACGIAAICKKKEIRSCRVGVDGSAFAKYPRFRERAAIALREILDWPEGEDLVTFRHAEDGSGVGAALIAALAEKVGKQQG